MHAFERVHHWAKRRERLRVTAEKDHRPHGKVNAVSGSTCIQWRQLRVNRSWQHP